MDDPKGGKGPYGAWSDPEHKMLLRLLVEVINQGFRDASGKFSKLTVETKILSTLTKELGTVKTYNQYKNRMKILKGRYQSFADFLRCNSGFGWDPVMKKFIEDDEVWNVYLEAHPGNKHLHDESFEDFEDFQMIFGQNVATGQNAMSLGNNIDVQPSQFGHNEEINDTNYVQMVFDAEGFISELSSDNGVVSSAGKGMGEKLPQRKKARIEESTVTKVCGELNAMNSQILGMLQKRWEQEAEEKEADDKANNVWDAIKEIPDLDKDLCYEAMTLVHRLGMKSGFVNMSIADRCGWIKGNLCKTSR